MAIYRYEGTNREGLPVSGTLEAPDRDAATELAQKRCRELTRLAPDYMKNLSRLLGTDMDVLLSGGRVRPKKLALLCTQLEISLRAGMPLVRSLELAARTAPDTYLKEVLQHTASDVQEGETLSDAFRSRCPGLPEVFLQTIQAGEESGTLSGSFRRLADHYSRSAATGAQIGSALVYPAMLLAVAAGVVAVILIYAVPVFEESFAGMGQSLPGPTAALVAVSGFLREHFLLLAACLACAVLGLILLGRTPQGKLLFGHLTLSLPGIGPLVTMNAAARYAETLGSLLDAGIPLLRAAATAAECVDNLPLRQALEQAGRGVGEGRSFAGGLRVKPLPPLLAEMAALGEETGQLAETLSLVSRHFAAETKNRLKGLLSILEPCITLALAVVVIFILLCVYLPVFGLYGGI